MPSRRPRCWPGAPRWAGSCGCGCGWTVQTSGLAVSSRWARLKLSPAAQDYLSPLPPGAPLTAAPSRPQPDRDSRSHFAVVQAQVQAMDWLELRPGGHRRALL